MDEGSTPVTSDLVLIGGGHAHVHVLKMFGMPPLKERLAKEGVRVTLIARDVMTPYSGMLPGYVSGHYTYEQIHLDLGKLCSFSGVALVHAAAVKVVHDKQGSEGGRGGGVVYVDDDRPPIRYDALSFDIGSSPAGFVVGSGNVTQNAVEHVEQSVVTPVKPISSFAAKYEEVKKRLTQNAKNYSPSNPFVLIVVGGGAGGIELALSVQFSLKALLKDAGVDENSLKILLATRGDGMLQGHNQKVRKIFERVMEERNVEIFYQVEAIGVEPLLSVSNGNGSSSGGMSKLKYSEASKNKPEIPFHECLWCTSAGAASWLAEETPFDTNADGFLMVNDSYQCVNHAGVFAAGDCCHMVNNPRPKAGVFAVRAGPPLRDNLVAYLCGEQLVDHAPQKEFLGLISTGDQYAVASRGCFAFEGAHLWTWKDRIDRQWMEGYQILPTMDTAKMQVPETVVARGAEAMAAFAEAPMRCGGCGAKVGATTVSRVLDAVRTRRIERRAKNKDNSPFLPPPIDHDDAAVFPLPKEGGGAMIHTIDFFRTFISDPFVFGRIAAVHALSDCHAMGAKPKTALALAVVPFAAVESITETTLLSMLSGASDALDEDECDLVGGHTCEGQELALGFTINGYTPNPDRLFRKRGGRVGDKLVLTKPIGTGSLFAADMRAKCKGPHVQAALKSMSRSNRAACEVAMDFGEKGGIHACTDVTGFGLVGHLLEMLVANDSQPGMDNVGAVLDLNKIPFLEGGLEASANQIYSSLQRENLRSRRAIKNHVEAAKESPVKYPLLFDPQTAGGLLFFVSSDTCNDFVAKLQHGAGEGCGNEHVAVIGELVAHEVDDIGGACTIGGGQTLSGQRITVRW